MTGRVLLDTNIVIALFAGEIPVMERLEDVSEVFVSSTVLGELFFGACRSHRFAENIRRVEEFAVSNRILPCDALTSRHYGEIKHQLRMQGTPIPENDIWIAAIVRQYRLNLATRDRHFKHVENLSLEYW